MVHYLIMCKSLTYAQRAARALERAGISAAVMRPPRSVSKEGCAYCLKISERRLAQALVVLKNAGMSYSRVYILHQNGETREVEV